MHIYENYLSFLDEPQRHDELFEEIVMSIKPLIDKNVKYIDKNYQDDFKQELLSKLFDILSNRKFNVKLFKNINCDNKRSEFINKLDESLLYKFISQSYENKKIYESISSLEGFNKFINSFTKFVGNVKIINFLGRCFYNLRIDFLRKNNKYEVEYFNEEEYCDYEPINYYTEKQVASIINGLSSKDKEFLKNFICDNRMLTQKEVAEKLNVSQQYISKKIRLIRNKVSNFKK